MSDRRRSVKKQVLQELADFIRFQSVSVTASCAEALRDGAAWLANHLRKIGFNKVSIHRTPRHPIVTAEWRHAPGKPTVLIYGHYDLQPVDPLDEWRSPPFAPSIREDYLYGRGASDDKGQLFIRVKTIESLLKAYGKLPVNVVCLFEGEEEIGSPNLGAFIRKYRQRLAANFSVISDKAGTPLQALSEIITGLHDANGLIAIPGFYDRVQRFDAQEREYMKRVGPSDAQLLRSAGVALGPGEPNYSLYELTTIRPALTVTGITGGYQGAGMKSVIPAKATAKLDIRLVPGQQPNEIEALLRDLLARIIPACVDIHLPTLLSPRPVSMDRRHPALRAAATAYSSIYGVEPVFLRSGVTIPVVGLIQDILNIPVVLMGLGLPDDHIHGPNERLHLSTFFRGIETSKRFLIEAGKIRRLHEAAA